MPVEGEIVDVRVLGPIEVVNGDAVALGGRTSRRLVAALALHQSEVVSMDRLVDMTWPDGAPHRAEHNIRSYVHRLRSALGARRTR